MRYILIVLLALGLSSTCFMGCSDQSADAEEIIILPDIDGDGIEDVLDNCPELFNPDQLDIDANLIGDMCEEAEIEPEPEPIPEPEEDSNTKPNVNNVSKNILKCVDLSKYPIGSKILNKLSTHCNWDIRVLETYDQYEIDTNASIDSEDYYSLLDINKYDSIKLIDLKDCSFLESDCFKVTIEETIEGDGIKPWDKHTN